MLTAYMHGRNGLYKPTNTEAIISIFHMHVASRTELMASEASLLILDLIKYGAIFISL